MARNLGALDKSSEARAQRDRNNLVSRVSRMKQKMLDQALEFEEQKINYENRQLKMRIAQNRVFVNELLELTGRDKVDLAAEWQIAQEETDYEMTDSESETDSTT